MNKRGSIAENQEQWQAFSAPLKLLANQIHVWRVELAADVDVERLRRLLSPDEEARADRYRFQQHRDRFIQGRGALRMILGQYVECAPDRLQFHYGAQGKPSLIPYQGQTVQFNLAHSEDLALVAIALNHAVGIDVEKIRVLPDADRLAERFFSAREHAALRALPAAAQQTAFFRYWTCKEAYLKAIGSGLAHGLDQVEVNLTESSAGLHCINGSVENAQQWSLWELKAAIDFAATVVAEGQDWALQCWQWEAVSD